MVTGEAAKSGGSVEYRPRMTLLDALNAGHAPRDTSVVVWRCEGGVLRRFRPDGDDFALRPHDWLVAPDPTSVY